MTLHPALFLLGLDGRDAGMYALGFLILLLVVMIAVNRRRGGL